MNVFLKVFLVSMILFSVGCTNLYYMPDRREYPGFQGEKIQPQSMFFNSSDGTALHAWHFEVDPSRCTKPKGLILHYHGNAQNLSAHYRLLQWITSECYEYTIFDYRGFGKSEGRAKNSGILLDARAALTHFSGIAQKRDLHLIVYGQSIGGTLLLRSLQIDGPPANLKAVVIESSFYDYKQIGREKLNNFFVTWPIQWLTYALVSGEASPGGRDFSTLSKIPKLLIYSEKDYIVTYNHGPLLYNELPEPKWFWTTTTPGHINSMFIESGRYRKQLIQWLDWVSQE